MAQLRIKIIGEKLPGRAVGPHTNVHIGVQKGTDVVDIVPAEGPSATFDISIAHRDDDFRGPYVHGKPGERFLYLSWVDVDDTGIATMFSRIKIMLSAIPAGLLRADTTSLEAYLALTDAKGKLVVASVRPPAITWSSA